MPLTEAIRRGLSSRPLQLPSALFYDALGSQLFEAITLLPEYGVSRTGLRMLHAHAAEMVALPGEIELLELGPGGGGKARILVDALRLRQERVRFVGVDVSQEALNQCRRTLEEIPGVTAAGVCDEYVPGLRRAVSLRTPGTRLLVLFLGSNISNFARDDARTFLRDVREALQPGDVMMLAADLEKPASVLLPAYDDALGVTAAFNKNALQRLNREWGANFDLDAWSHVARWNEAERRVEMHLRALRPQHVRIERLSLSVDVREGETIWTESSHRFRIDELQDWAKAAGFRWCGAWIDAEWPLAQCLLEA
jgi:L-histidine N-alpha-methyltransferase